MMLGKRKDNYCELKSPTELKTYFGTICIKELQVELVSSIKTERFYFL